ncbi:MAG: puromycin-sensitive aminopeptidase [Thermoplasmata archaeon]|nr:puromycin-sensitive aminopeptidase [Thermoplasmata archaeon]
MGLPLRGRNVNAKERRASAGAMQDYRLPTSLRPVRCAIHLDADPARPTFSGTVRIEAEASAALPEVRLHATGLRVREAFVTQGGKRVAAPVAERKEVGQVVLQVPVAAGTLTIEVAYEGDVAKGMAGLYHAKDGHDVCLATQCEATDARAFVPCFDEPGFKAVFEWTVTAPEGMVVLANTAAVRKEGTTWTFTPTPRMSSYLLALAIGPFEGTAPTEERGVPFQVFAIGGKHPLGATAQAFSHRLLAWYEDYFGQPYAFGKYDQVAIPSFAFGAMENPGLVTFRPSLLLLDPAKATWDERKDVNLVVAHEFAHMWFGNLVTMAWWDDLWLNEAFAEWVAHKSTAELSPELDVWTRFRQRAAGALATDALAATHAIYHPVKTAQEAQEMFDAITYGKGSAVMRMLEAYLGPDRFRAGLRAYMAEFRFANAKGPDLWRHLAAASGQDVGAIMGAWVTKPGHPVVRAGWDGHLQLRQERARSSPGPAEPGAWPVPMVVRYADDAGTHTHPVLFGQAQATVELPVRGRLRWLWPNAGDVGFFRCSLEGPLLQQALASGGLAPEEQAALLRDLWGELRAGNVAPEAFLAAFEGIAARLQPGARYDLVGHLVGTLRGLEALLEAKGEEPALAGLRQAARVWLRPAYEADARAGAAAPPDARKRRASLLRGLAAIARDPAAAAEARAAAAQERADAGALDPDLAAAAVASEAVLGDGATLAVHMAEHRARRDANAAPQLVERYLYSLGAFRGAGEVDRVLAELASGTIAPQAVGPILRGMLGEPHSATAAWRHLQAHWPKLKESLGEAWVAILVEGSGELPVDLEAEVLAFWGRELHGAAGQALGRAKERLAARRAFEARVGPALASWAARLPRAFVPAR